MVIPFDDTMAAKTALMTAKSHNNCRRRNRSSGNSTGEDGGSIGPATSRVVGVTSDRAALIGWQAMARALLTRLSDETSWQLVQGVLRNRQELSAAYR
jgi:hypothetical protein